MSTDTTFRDNEALSVIHYNKEGYLSGFGVNNPDVMTTLRLRLGSSSNSRDVELTVLLELSPVSASTETPTLV